MTKPISALTRLHLAVAATALLSGPALAQNSTQLPTIEITGVPTSQEAVYQSPTASTVVSAGEIDLFGLGYIDNVLRAQTGVFTRDSTSNAGIAVNIRGFEGSGRVNMMIDGVRQNFRFTGHEAQGFLFIDPQLLAGVDIQRGAVAGVGGSGALAGTANFRTLGVEDILLPGRNFGALNSLTWGSNGVGLMNMIAGAARLGSNVAIAGAFAFRDSNAYRNGNDQIVPFAGAQDLQSGLFKIDLAPTENSTLKLGYVAYDNNYVANSFNQDVRSDTFTAKYRWKPLNDLIDYRLNLNASTVRMHYRNHFSGVPNASDGRTITDRGLGFDTSNTSRFTLGAIAVAMQNGVEFFHDDFKSYLGGVNPSATQYVGGVFNQTKFSYGIFELTTALRYDFYNLRGAGDVTLAGPFLPAGPYSVDESGDRLNPKITLAAQVLPWLQPFVTYAESMRAPTTFEMMVGGNHPGVGTGSYVPNPFLKPEMQEGFEIGANIVRNDLFAKGDAFRAKVMYYNQDVSNYITACGNGPSVFMSTIIWFCNVPGTSDVNGIELQASYDAGFAFAGITYTQTNLKLPMQTPGFGASQYPPKHNTVVTLGIRTFEQRLTTGIRAYFVSDTIEAGFTGPSTRPGYELLDLFVEYKIRPTWTVSATVTNLTDEAYTPALQTPQTGTFVGPLGRGRTVLLNTRTQF